MIEVTRSATEVLASVETGVTRRRAGDLAELVDVLAWCALHSVDPQASPGAASEQRGGDRLRHFGGDGTPRVAALASDELAIARCASIQATGSLMADALDLVYRLPQTWAAAQDLPCEMWVLRKVARLSRPLTREQARVVDEAVAGTLAQSPGRVLEITEAKVIEADPDAHDRRVEENRRRRGVWLTQPTPGDQVEDPDRPGVRGLFARLAEGDAIAVDHTVAELADALAEEYATAAPEGAALPGGDELRAEALGRLADPHDAAALLDAAAEDPQAATETDRPDEPPGRGRWRGQLFVHLHAGALHGITGHHPAGHAADAGSGTSPTAGSVARVEGLGPVLLSQLRDLFGEGCEVTVTPVIDLHEGRSVNGYEHPDDVRRRTELRTAGDVFPHSAHTTRRNTQLDHDHPTAYDRDGPPGQTGDDNDAPLTRRHHRVKTHLGYQVIQTGPGFSPCGEPPTACTASSTVTALTGLPDSKLSCTRSSTAFSWTPSTPQYRPESPGPAPVHEVDVEDRVPTERLAPARGHGGHGRRPDGEPPPGP